nr:MAG TPA_asm: hypothetical protein [Caudoviricetes sp.]
MILYSIFVTPYCYTAERLFTLNIHRLYVTNLIISDKNKSAPPFAEKYA